MHAPAACSQACNRTAHARQHSLSCWTAWLHTSCLQANAFSSVSVLRLLGGLLAPYCSMLTYSTRLTEMRRLVNDLIAPIAASLAQQKSSQLAKLGCTVEEAPPGAVHADGKGICVAVGSQGKNNSARAIGSSEPVTQPVPVAAVSSSSGSLRQRKGSSGKGAGGASASSGKGSGKAAGGSAPAAAAAAAHTSSARADSQVSHKRFESGAHLSRLSPAAWTISSGYHCCL